MATILCFEFLRIIPNYDAPISNMYKVKIDKNEFEVESGDNGLTVNGVSLDWDFAAISERHFHIINKNKSYNAEVIKVDAASKSVSVKVKGTTHVVSVKDRFDLLLEKMGMDASAIGKINSIKAPMPGLIIDMKVKPGDEVKAGDPLLVLEAMKMENVIKSSGEGVVKSVKAKKGDSVEKNQVLIEF